MPAVGSSTPMRMFSSVLFPQPEPPRMVKTSPGKTSKTHPVEHGGAVGERLYQIPHHEQWLGGLRWRRRQIHFGE